MNCCFINIIISIIYGVDKTISGAVIGLLQYGLLAINYYNIFYYVLSCLILEYYGILSIFIISI